MLVLLASEWVEIIRRMEDLGRLSNAPEMVDLIHGETSEILNALRKLSQACNSIGLRFSASYADELIASVESHLGWPVCLNTSLEELSKRNDRKDLTPQVFVNEITILKKRIDDELRNVEFFSLEPGKSSFLNDPYLFGVNVFNRFPSATLDIEEAGKCLAFGRFTACVFHLMRVIEAGLRELGKSLNDPNLNPKTNPNWERILKRCDDELKKPYADRSPEWQKGPQFFADATANLRAVKDAWRNPSLHVEISYDEEKCSDVWNAVRAFMRHLAEGLPPIP
ncbi:MAG: hypothetical protein WB992_04340 [Bryobacteraceae bacterium]